jgi:hypothetical protein
LPPGFLVAASWPVRATTTAVAVGVAAYTMFALLTLPRR